MAFERIRNLYDTGPDRSQPVKVEDTRQPQDVANPHTTEDETNTSLRARLAQSKVKLAAYSAFGIVVVVVLAIWGGRFFATVLSNTWVQLGAWTLGVAALTGHTMYKSGQSSLRTDEVMLREPDGNNAINFLAEVKESKHGDYYYFVPYKGTRSGGYAKEPYKAGDLHPNMPDDVPARIRLQEANAAVAITNTGLRAIQETAGIEPDPQGSETNFKVTLPDQAAKSTVTDLKETIESLRRENSNLQRRNNMLRRQRDDLAEEGSKSREEVREELEEQFVTVGSVVNGRNGSTSTQREREDQQREKIQHLKEELEHEN